MPGAKAQPARILGAEVVVTRHMRAFTMAARARSLNGTPSRPVSAPYSSLRACQSGPERSTSRLSFAGKCPPPAPFICRQLIPLLPGPPLAPHITHAEKSAPAPKQHPHIEKLAKSAETMLSVLHELHYDAGSKLPGSLRFGHVTQPIPLIVVPPFPIPVAVRDLLNKVEQKGAARSGACRQKGPSSFGGRRTYTDSTDETSDGPVVISYRGRSERESTGATTTQTTRAFCAQSILGASSVFYQTSTDCISACQQSPTLHSYQPIDVQCQRGEALECALRGEPDMPDDEIRLADGTRAFWLAVRC
ncbi:hypothetical protein C8F01DRAFT_1196092 [Mycena amicta]|nr:hypothetical protein C8F01DRAFT_1196092 [Mycena amicta]